MRAPAALVGVDGSDLDLGRLTSTIQPPSWWSKRRETAVSSLSARYLLTSALESSRGK